MVEKELITIWKDSSQTELIKFETSRLLLELNKRMSHIDKSIRNRDFLEIAVAIFIIPFFATMGWLIPFFVSKLGCILIAIWAGYVIYKLKSTKKNKRTIDLTLSVQDQLEKYKAYIIKQADLLDSVMYWYLLPPFIGIMVIIIGVDPNSLPLDFPDPIRTSLFNDFILLLKVGYLILVTLLYAAIRWANKRAMRKTYKPIIRDLENVQSQLKSEY